MDRITEEIAHFIGLFHLTVEEARIRETYLEFAPGQATPAIPDQTPLISATFAAPYELIGFEPWVPYEPLIPQIVKLFPRNFVKFKQIEILDDGSFGLADPDFVWPTGASRSLILPEIEPPGSVVNYLNQIIHLSDDDYFGVGGHGMFFSPGAIGNGELLELAAIGLALSPIGTLERPGSPEAIRDFITSASADLEAFTVEPEGPAQVFMHRDITIDSVYVNGALVEEAPKLEDYHSFEDEQEEEEEAAPVKNAQLTQEGRFIVDASVDLDTGSNTLVNNAVFKNLWTAATVTAVAGDRFELNAVIQINVLADDDSVSSLVKNWSQDDAVNQFFNIATFERSDPLDDRDPAAVKVGFPKHWVVTEIKADLMIVNWLDQFIVQSDNDIGIVSSSGVTTSIVAGGNLGVNQVSLYELAFAYDLIIIGGGWYDANIIHQMNVLFDNDLVGAVSGFKTTGEGSISTSGNLLWNQAHIYNVGGANSEAMPSHYREAVDNFANGDQSLPGGVLGDELFAGIGALRVLYIEGDLLNLQYIKQTNILGDSDQIALAMTKFTPHPDADWTITTGSNALLNNAAIVDLDSLGKTYVGGQQYSQELLFQAELISNKPDVWGQNPDVLVNEAIAFLDDSMAAQAYEAVPGVFLANDLDAHQADGLQTMLG